MLRQLSPEEALNIKRKPLKEEAFQTAAAIISDIKQGGDIALRRYALKFKELEENDPLILSREDLKRAWDDTPGEQQELLSRTAERIKAFAQNQLSCLKDMTSEGPWGKAGHTVRPLENAGCYAPGGRFPYPSSVLMTAIPARVAGVKDLTICSPRPVRATRAAAFIAGADRLLCPGGAHGVAALAYGTESVRKCDIIAGPGNRYVTAAKFIVSRDIKIDMLAGPSELLIVADSSADASSVAADLLAQAEHDPDAIPVLLSLSEKLIKEVNREIDKQLESLPTGETARKAVSQNGFAVLCQDLPQAAKISNYLAPEHLELIVQEAGAFGLFTNFGALFKGDYGAEVFCDYGAGPNHVLPTGGIAKLRGGLSVFDFLKIQTWFEGVKGPALDVLISDSAELAGIEGLEGHRRSALARRNI